MSTFGTSNHTTSLFPSVGRHQPTVAVDVLRTSFVAVLEESQRKNDEPSERVSEQKRRLEGLSQRKNLDRHEIETSFDRNRQLDGEYQYRLDRREFFNEKPVAEPVTQTSTPVAMSGDVLRTSLPLIPPNATWTQQSTATEPPGVIEPPTILPTVPANVDFSPTLPFPQSATFETPLLPMVSAPTVPVDSMPKPPSDPSAFTIFTVSGRFSNEKKDKDNADRKTEKRGVSLFGSLLPPVDDETPSEPAQATRRFKIPDESPERKPVEPANIEPPKKEAKGIPLEELFDSKVFIPTHEPYKGKLDTDAQIQADRVRFIQRVAAACQAAAHRNGTIRIKLRPESLGPLTVRVSTKKGKLSVHFETATDEAKRLLLGSLDDLKVRLRKMHYELDECRVD